MGCSVLCGFRSRDVQVQSGQKWVGGRYGAATSQRTRGPQNWVARGVCGERDCTGDCEGGGVRSAAGASVGVGVELSEHNGARVAAAVRGTGKDSS